MLWHAVILDVKNADVERRKQLESAIAALADIEQVLWLRYGIEPADGSIGFLSVFEDSTALEAYRGDPLHLELVRQIRACGAVVHRLNFEGPPPPV